jgi:hypothetical protein
MVKIFQWNNIQRASTYPQAFNCFNPLIFNVLSRSFISYQHKDVEAREMTIPITLIKTMLETVFSTIAPVC